MIPISRQPEYYRVGGATNLLPDVMARPVAPIKPRSQSTKRKQITHETREQEFEFPNAIYAREDDRDHRLREQDYYEQLELAPESRYPDRYGWDQYDRAYNY